MKKNKRLIAVLLSIVLALNLSSLSSSFSVGISAANYLGEYAKSTVAYMSEAEIYFEGNCEVGLGEQVQIPVRIRNNPGLMGFAIRMNYDENILRPVSATKGSMITNGIFDDNIETATSNVITMYWSGNSETSADGILFYVTFEVIGNKVSQSVIGMDYQQDDTFDENWQSVPLNCGNITVKINGTSEEINTLEEKTTSENTVNNKTTIVGGTYSFEDNYVNVPIMMKNNHGIMGYRIRLYYDNTVLQPMIVERTNVYDGSFVDNIGVKTNYFDVIWTGTGNIYGDLELFVAKFQILKPITELATIGISYIQGDTFDENWKDVILDCSNIDIIGQNESTSEISTENTTEEKTSVETTKEVTTQEGTSSELTTIVEPTITVESTQEEVSTDTTNTVESTTRAITTIEPTTKEVTTQEDETDTFLPPTKPTGIQGEVDENDNYNLSWILSDRAVYYNIYVDGENIGNTVSERYRIPASFFTYNGEYKLEVEAVNTYGVSEKAAITYIVDNKVTTAVEPTIVIPTTTAESTTTVEQTTLEITTGNSTTKKAETTTVNKGRIIVPSKVKGLKLKNIRKKRIKVSWKWKAYDAKSYGWQVQYSKKKKFKNAKIKNVKWNKKTIVLKKLRKKKTYYVRVRAWAINGDNIIRYGAWSSVKKCKIRK